VLPLQYWSRLHGCGAPALATGEPVTPATLLPPTSASSLVRLRGEPIPTHRALLLYAMAGERRTFALIGRVAHKSDATIRTWALRWEWERRYRETPDADTESYILYQRNYLARYGPSAVIRLTESVVEPLGFLAQIDAAMLERDAEAHSEPPPGTPPLSTVPATPDVPLPRPASVPGPLTRAQRIGPRPEVRQPDPELTARVTASLGLGSAPPVGPTPEVLPAGTFSPPAPAGPPRDLSLERDIKLLDGALGYCAQALKDGKVPVTLSGIASLLKTKQLLLGRSTANVAVVVQSTGPAPVPTVRVQQAQSDAARLAAYREDVADLATILDGIEAGAERDAEIVTTGDERERA
jgi:hypothetical protein